MIKIERKEVNLIGLRKGIIIWGDVRKFWRILRIELKKIVEERISIGDDRIRRELRIEKEEIDELIRIDEENVIELIEKIERKEIEEVSIFEENEIIGKEISNSRNNVEEGWVRRRIYIMNFNEKI